MAAQPPGNRARIPAPFGESPSHYQIFFLSVIKQQSALTVARSLGTNLGQVYMAKHRLLRKFRQALKEAEIRLDAQRVPPCPEPYEAS